MMSRIYLNEHDDQCVYKIIECKCGERFPRHELDHHTKQVCKLREVERPFNKVGCTKTVQVCVLQAHLAEEVDSHLILIMNRMMEHQDVINDLNFKVSALEEENKDLKLALQSHVKKSTTDMCKIETNIKKSSKALAAHEVTCKKEFIKLSR